MTELYRGLLYVLTTNFNTLIEVLRDHIRSFKRKTNDEGNFLDVGVLGFWNLILEVIFTLFVLLCLVAGVLLTVFLAVAAYPVVAFLTYSSNLLVGTRGKQDKDLQIIKITDEQIEKK